MAIIDVKLVDKVELTLPAVGGDWVYIRRNSAGGGFTEGDYKIRVSNLVSNYLSYANDGGVPTPSEGTSYFNTTTKEFRGYNGTSWVNLSFEARSFLHYVGTLSQSGSNDPVLTEQINTLGVTPNFLRTNIGTYEWDARGESWFEEPIVFFIENKASPVFGIRGHFALGWFNIVTGNFDSGTAADSHLGTTTIEIKIYT